MASIAVKTNDMRFYNKILKLSQRSSIKMHFFPESHQISEGKYDIVITTSKKAKYKQNSHILYLTYEDLNTETIPNIVGLISRNHNPKFQKMLIGIDPGKHIGVAVICDGMVLSARTVYLEQLINVINSNLLSFPSENVCIKIGDQPSCISEVIFNRIFNVFKKFAYIQMEIVPEADSNIGNLKTQKSFSTDEKAAIIIGLRSGKIQTQLITANISEGRVKEIQKWSREKSGNLTIDSKLAKLVAIGEITLENAISIKSQQTPMLKKNENKTDY